MGKAKMLRKSSRIRNLKELLSTNPATFHLSWRIGYLQGAVRAIETLGTYGKADEIMIIVIRVFELLRAIGLDAVKLEWGNTKHRLMNAAREALKGNWDAFMGRWEAEIERLSKSLSTDERAFAVADKACSFIRLFDSTAPKEITEMPLDLCSISVARAYDRRLHKLSANLNKNHILQRAKG